MVLTFSPNLGFSYLELVPAPPRETWSLGPRERERRHPDFGLRHRPLSIAPGSVERLSLLDHSSCL